MQEKIALPIVSNFIHSIRDFGYTFEVAVADILDNSISARALNIEIYALLEPNFIFCVLDDGFGMSENELYEAMRLGAKSPHDKRNLSDLGKFGLGLKTASFSQCKKLTVISKKEAKICAMCWDIDILERDNEWKVLILDENDLSIYKELEIYQKFQRQNSGTLVIWEKIDKHKKEDFAAILDKLKKHLALVFHRFLEKGQIKISLNNDILTPFNPFNPMHPATLQRESENIKIGKHSMKITPYILPHHSKLSQQEWDKFGMDEGYTKTQGFYLYRADRLLIYGTWWGLHRTSDVHKLVRICIDISNTQDDLWGVDVKKSTAEPNLDVKKELKRIINYATKDGEKPLQTRAKKINDKNIIRFWSIISNEGKFYFDINKEHPLFEDLSIKLSKDKRNLLECYLKGLQAYLPLDTIQAKLQESPHSLAQKECLSNEEVENLALKLKEYGLNDEQIKRYLKTEIFKDRKDLINE